MTISTRGKAPMLPPSRTPPREFAVHPLPAPARRGLPAWSRPARVVAAAPFMREQKPEPRRGYDGKLWLPTFEQYAATRAAKATANVDMQRECVRCGYGWFPTESGGERLVNIDRIDFARRRLEFFVTGVEGRQWCWSAGSSLPDAPPPTPKPAGSSPNEHLVQVPLEHLEREDPAEPSALPVTIVHFNSTVRDYDEKHGPARRDLQEKLKALQARRKDTKFELWRRDYEAQLACIEEGSPVHEAPEAPHTDVTVTSPSSTADRSFRVTDLDAAPPARRRCGGCTLL